MSRTGVELITVWKCHTSNYSVNNDRKGTLDNITYHHKTFVFPVASINLGLTFSEVTQSQQM